MSPGETSVLPIPMLEASEISLEGVSGSRNGTVVKVMEHVRQCGEQHAASTLKVAEYPSALAGRCDARSKAILPLPDVGTEPITSRERGNRHNLKENISKVLGVRSRRLPAAPHQALTLNMHQTALDDGFRVQMLQGPYQVRISVAGDIFRLCATILQPLAEAYQINRSFGHIVLPMDNGPALCVQRRVDTSASFEKGPVEHHVREMR